jgi:hypothetical protein
MNYTKTKKMLMAFGFALLVTSATACTYYDRDDYRRDYSYRRDSRDNWRYRYDRYRDRDDFWRDRYARSRYWDGNQAGSFHHDSD